MTRPRTIMGHGRLGIFQILFEWIREGYNIPVLGRGDNVYQFVHADDLAEACILAAARPGPTTYNCGALRPGTMRRNWKQTLLSDGHLMIRHPNWDAAYKIAFAAATDVTLYAGG